MLSRCSKSAQDRYVVGCQSLVGGLAEAGHCTQHGVGQRPVADLVVTDTDGGPDAEGLSDPPSRLAGTAEAASEAVANGCIGRRMRGLAQHGTRESACRVGGDVLVEGEVAASALGAGGEQGEGTGLAGARTCLQDEMAARAEVVGGLGLFVGGRGQAGLRERGGIKARGRGCSVP
jgi:hypothetical protein